MALSQTETLLNGMVADIDHMIEAYGSLDSCSRHLVSIIKEYVSVDVSDIDVDSNKQAFDSAKRNLVAKMNAIVDSLDQVEVRNPASQPTKSHSETIAGKLVNSLLTAEIRNRWLLSRFDLRDHCFKELYRQHDRKHSGGDQQRAKYRKMLHDCSRVLRRTNHRV